MYTLMYMCKYMCTLPLYLFCFDFGWTRHGSRLA